MDRGNWSNMSDLVLHLLEKGKLENCVRRLLIHEPQQPWPNDSRLVDDGLGVPIPARVAGREEGHAGIRSRAAKST